jgi:hypothetical protein
MANNLNIGSIVSPDVLKVISSSTAIKTFGDQLVNKAKDKVISVASGKVQTLKDQIQEIITLKIKVGIDHNIELKRLDVLLKEKQITQEKYDKAVIKEDEAYQQKLDNLDALSLKLNEDLAKIIADPLAKIKLFKNKREVKKAERIVRNKVERAKARRDLTKKVIKNAAKTLAPIIALQIVNQLSSIISQRAKLEELVDQVNIYIEQANTPETIIIATNLRNNAITLINNSIKKLENLKKNIERISKIILIFNAIILALNLAVTFLPPLTPPIIPKKITDIINKASALVAALSVILVIANTILENEISKLNDLIERLKAINALLDDQSNLNLNEQQFADLSNTFLPIGNNQFEEYKGFKFKIKEEQTLGAQQAIVVKGNKRRYAVAIDRDGVEVIKSELSFTLDPQDLIDQLKLVIDQRNLQG